MSQTISPDRLLHDAGLVDPEAQLAAFMQRQRWFTLREHALERVEIEDAGKLEGDPEVYTVLVRAHYAGGGSDRYHLPLTVRPAGAFVEGLVGEGARDGKAVAISDALLDGAAAERFWQLLRGRVELLHGELVGVADGYDPPRDRVHPFPRDQSNTMLVRGEDELLKCFRQLERASSPEFEMLTALGAAAFRFAPAPLGVIEYRAPGDEPVVVAMLQPFLHNATDGWALAMTSLRDLYADAEASNLQDDSAIRAHVDDQGSNFTPDAHRLGGVIAEMHLALASERVPESMRAASAGKAELNAWADEMVADFDQLMRNDATARVDAPAVRRRIAQLRELTEGGRAIRIHGDLHLGQMVRTDDGWMVLDFEGEPQRSVEERRRKSSPLRDVAGMIRSFEYAAAVAVLDRADLGEETRARMHRFGDIWASLNRDAFLSTYLSATDGSGLLPAPDVVALMLEAYMVQKAIYEVRYELSHRPEWAWIPLRFLEGLT